jgi:N-acetylglutamate synthase-like GNAT family acetyltransferase
MQGLEQGLAAMDVEKIYLLTARGSRAEAFYQKCGFYISPKMIMMAKCLGY